MLRSWSRSKPNSVLANAAVTNSIAGVHRQEGGQEGRLRHAAGPCADEHAPQDDRRNCDRDDREIELEIRQVVQAPLHDVERVVAAEEDLVRADRVERRGARRERADDEDEHRERGHAEGRPETGVALFGGPGDCGRSPTRRAVPAGTRRRARRTGPASRTRARSHRSRRTGERWTAARGRERSQEPRAST